MADDDLPVPDTPKSMIIALQVGRICGLLAIPLHVFVIGAIIKYRKTDPALNKSYFHMLANLCTIDLIRIIELIILKTYLYSLEGWRTSNKTILPRFDATWQYFAYQANLFALTAIAINRLIEMAFPLKAKEIWTSNITIMVNAGSWLCGIAFAAPMVLSVHKLEHLPIYQGIFWSNDWDNQTAEDVETSKAYMDIVSTGALTLFCMLVVIYVMTFAAMIKHRSTHRNSTNQQKKKYKAEVNLSIQALMLASFVFMYNIGIILYNRECCPWFVAPDLVTMLWAAHYSGPMFALSMSTVLRNNVKKLFNMDNSAGPSGVGRKNKDEDRVIELNDMAAAGPSNRVKHVKGV